MYVQSTPRIHKKIADAEWEARIERQFIVDDDVKEGVEGWVIDTRILGLDKHDTRRI